MGVEVTFNYGWLMYVGIVFFIAIVATCIRHRHSICGGGGTPAPVAKNTELAIVGQGTGIAPGNYTPQQQMQLQQQQYYPASGAPAQHSYPATGAVGNYPSTGVQGNYPSTGVSSPYQPSPYQAQTYPPVQQPYPAMQQPAPYSPVPQPSPNMYAHAAPAVSGIQPTPAPLVDNKVGAA